MAEQKWVEIAVPSPFDEADAREAVDFFTQSLQDAAVNVKQAAERMQAPVHAGPFYDFGISVAASLAAQLLWALVGAKRDGIKRLYDRLAARFPRRDVHIYVRIRRPDEKIITYRLPQDPTQALERIELIVAQLDLENPNRLTL